MHRSWIEHLIDAWIPEASFSSWVRWAWIGLHRAFALIVSLGSFQDGNPVYGFLTLIIWGVVESLFVTHFYRKEKRDDEEWELYGGNES